MRKYKSQKTFKNTDNLYLKFNLENNKSNIFIGFSNDFELNQGFSLINNTNSFQNGEFWFKYKNKLYGLLKADIAKTRFNIEKDILITIFDSNFFNDELLLINENENKIGIGRKIFGDELKEKIILDDNNVYFKNNNYYFIDNRYSLSANNYIIYDYEQFPLSLFLKIDNNNSNHELLNYKNNDIENDIIINFTKTDKIINFSVDNLENKIYNNLMSDLDYYLIISTDGLISSINVIL